MPKAGSPRAQTRSGLRSPMTGKRAAGKRRGGVTRYRRSANIGSGGIVPGEVRELKSLLSPKSGGDGYPRSSPPSSSSSSSSNSSSSSSSRSSSSPSMSSSSKSSSSESSSESNPPGSSSIAVRRRSSSFWWSFSSVSK